MSFPLETPCRLSSSVLWRLQRRYFERRGIAAWSEGEVPHQVTSSPRLAAAYCDAIAGWLRDWQAVIDPAQPVYVVELGAGSGRLAFHVVRQLAARAGALPAARAVRYVMTDFADATLAAWRAHPRLARWLDGGQLDIARFDAERDTAIALERSGATLAPGAPVNPVVAIANYVFDSVPHDVFSVADGELHEWRVRLCSRWPDGDLDDPAVLGRATLACELRPVAAAGYYGDPVLDAVLDEHRARLDATAFTFPVASLRCLARLADLAGGRLLVLSADKGDIAEDALRGQAGPNLTLHGSFSIAVNYHAIARVVRLRGGEAMLPAARPRQLAGCAFALGAPPGGAVETRRAYDADLAHSPDELVSQITEASAAAATRSLDGWLACFAATGDDPAVVAAAAAFIAPLVAGARPADRARLAAVLARARDAQLSIGDADDIDAALDQLGAALGADPSYPSPP